MTSTQHVGTSAVLVLVGSVALNGSNVTAAGQPAQAAPAAASADRADALSEAARKGDAATVKRLLDEGLDVNTK